MIIQEDTTDYCLGDNVGFSNVEQVCGSDLVVVNSARVSYGGESERLEDKDKKNYTKIIDVIDDPSKFSYYYLHELKVTTIK